MNIDLSDEESAALIRELADITGQSRYPPSPPRTRTLKATLAKLRPEPVWDLVPPPNVYAPPRAVLGRRRRRG